MTVSAAVDRVRFAVSEFFVSRWLLVFTPRWLGPTTYTLKNGSVTTSSVQIENGGSAIAAMMGPGQNLLWGRSAIGGRPGFLAQDPSRQVRPKIRADVRNVTSVTQRNIHIFVCLYGSSPECARGMIRIIGL